MIASQTFDSADDDTAAFVVLPITDISHYWIGYYNSRLYWAVANGNAGSKESATFVNSNGESMQATTALENTDSGMTMSWNNLAGGSTVKFQFNVGTVAATGAKAGAAVTELAPTSIDIADTDPAQYYRLYKKNESGSDTAVTGWMPGTGATITINDLQTNTKYYVITITKEAFDEKQSGGDVDLSKIDPEAYVVGEDLQTAVQPAEYYVHNDYGISVTTRIARSGTTIRLKHPNPDYYYGLMKGDEVVYACAAPNNGSDYYFENLTPSTEYKIVAICPATGNNNCTPIEVSTKEAGALEDFVNETGILPGGQIYGEIDYDIDYIQDNIFYATDESGAKLNGSYINLSKETLVTDFQYDYYSRNGGKSWSKGPITEKKLQSMLNSGMTLVLCKGNPRKKEIEAKITFPEILARPKLVNLRVDYLIYADPSGLTNGMWTVTYKGTEGMNNQLLFAEAAADGKRVGIEGWGLWPEEDGVWVLESEKVGTVTKKTFFYKIPACGNRPASKAKKVSVLSLGKAVKTKANYSYETLIAVKGQTVFFGAVIPDTRTDQTKLYKQSVDAMPFEKAGKNVSNYDDIVGKAYRTHTAGITVDLSAYLTTERNTVIVWQQASSTAPATAKTTIVLASRSTMDEVELEVVSGSVHLKQGDTKYAVYNEKNGKWTIASQKATENKILRIRLKSTAKGGKENDNTHAWGIEGYLVCITGVYNEHLEKVGIVSAKIYLTREAAEAALAAANAAAAEEAAGGE